MEQGIRRTIAYAAQMRYDVVRMIENVKSGHPGGSLSCVDILACLYFDVMRICPDEPDWPGRDRFVLSKGHAAPALYAALARRGYFPATELGKLRQIGGILEGHPDHNHTPGVDATTGCLGEGLSIGIGMALAARLDHADYYVYVVLGDGETNEGQIWEAAQVGAHYGLGHLVVFLDLNNLQFDGTLDEVLRPWDLSAKWKTFGWDVQDIDGHDHRQILRAVSKAKNRKNRPHMVICQTTKGKGAPVMENQCAWHSIVNLQQMNDCLPKLAQEIRRYEDILNAADVW